MSPKRYHQSSSLLILTLIAIVLSGCLGPYTYPDKIRKTGTASPSLDVEQATMADGYVLPTVTYRELPAPRAVVLALHGFNDYRRAFVEVGNYLGARNISLIAYDQRGFGETEGRGYWHGNEALVHDLLTMVQLVRVKYPDTPLYILGESMGGAVTLASLPSFPATSGVHGIILIAPAVWAYHTMPWYQRGPMWFLAHMLPWFHLSGEGLDILPSDNIKMLRSLGRDPLVIKGARADVVYGLTSLMSEALATAAAVDLPALILYGKNDEIVPKKPTCEMVKGLLSANSSQWKFTLYEDGYHMLTRDLQGQQVIEDIERWITAAEKGESESDTVSAEDMEFICQ